MLIKARFLFRFSELLDGVVPGRQQLASVHQRDAKLNIEPDDIISGWERSFD